MHHQHFSTISKAAAIAALIAAGLTGCATAPGATEIGPKPANWREVAMGHVQSSFIDPSSIRDASIAEPIPASMVFDGVTHVPHSGWMVCLRANGKNRFGAYTGQQLTGLLFQNGKLALTLAEPEFAVAHHCEGAAYAPFSL